jgi:diguanylate cyclase (GGDEF)-like protein/PAS domain S-box-containing protein
VGTLQDVTDRKRLELKLEANERFIRGITDNLPVRIAYLDSERRFEFVNRTLVERMQTTREAMMGRSMLEFAPLPLRDALNGLWSEVVHGRAQRYEYEDVVDGDARYIEMQLIPDRGCDGDVRGMFMIGADITHRRRAESALRELTEVFDNTTDFVAQTDWRGQMRFINRSARRAVGLDELASLEGYSFRDFYPPDTIEQYVQEIIPAVRRAGVWVGESNVLLREGRITPVEHMVIGHHDAEGRVCRYSSVMRDITEEVSARKVLSRQTAIINTVIEAIPAMMAVFDRDMRYLLVNEGYERWRGLKRESLIGRSLQETLAPEEFERTRPTVERSLSGETIYDEREYPDAARPRHISLTYVPLKLADGDIAGFFGFAQDITREREERIRLTLLAERDTLTGLFNRAGFEQFMDSKVNHGHSATLAMIYIDLDHFKPINDTYGHAAGDLVLTVFASRLQHLVRPDDAVARLGGDEFAVALCGVRDIRDAGKVAEKILLMSRAPLPLGRDNADSALISASVGVARDASSGWKDLVERADAMAYRAKAAGRDRYVLEEEHGGISPAAGALA